MIGYVENGVGGRSGIGGNSYFSMNWVDREVMKGVGRISSRDRRGGDRVSETPVGCWR